MSNQRAIQKWIKGILCFGLVLGVILCLPLQSQAAAKKKGWVTSEGEKYYYVSGQPTTGLQKIKSHTYYFDLSDGKMLRDKWKKIEGKSYYFQSNGRMAKKQWIGKYYVLGNGERAKNRWISGQFVGENGKKIPNFRGGWQQISGKRYYYTAAGVKKTGWLTYHKKRYYLNKNGVMQTKQVEIKNKFYYFTKNGVLKKKSWVKIGKWYYYANTKGVLNILERMNRKTYQDATKMQYVHSKINVKIEKVTTQTAVYWVAHVKIKNSKQLKSAMAYGTYGGSTQLTSSAVKENKGIIGINGSRFDGYGRPGAQAVMIKNGKIYNRAAGTSYTVMAVSNDGTMYTPRQGLSADALLKDKVKDTYDFGPVLLQDGNAVPLTQQGDPNNFSLVSYRDPRTAVGMVKPGEYVLLVADGRRAGYSWGLNYTEMLSIFRSYQCVYAYNLDGGGSSAMYFAGRLLNRPSDATGERPCGDFLFFTK